MVEREKPRRGPRDERRGGANELELFVGNLPEELTVEKIASLFSGTTGVVRRLTRTSCRVEFKDAASAAAALAKGNITINGNEARVEASR